jgi:hypothetical protein
MVMNTLASRTNLHWMLTWLPYTDRPSKSFHVANSHLRTLSIFDLVLALAPLCRRRGHQEPAASTSAAPASIVIQMLVKWVRARLRCRCLYCVPYLGKHAIKNLYKSCKAKSRLALMLRATENVLGPQCAQPIAIGGGAYAVARQFCEEHVCTCGSF